MGFMTSSGLLKLNSLAFTKSLIKAAFLGNNDKILLHLPRAEDMYQRLKMRPTALIQFVSYCLKVPVI
jgi:hypothetical protein